MLAYLFWHQPAAGVAAAAYEESLRAFHRALSEHKPHGYLGSASFGFQGTPWFPAQPGYLDWYTVADFTSLGLLNEAAVAGARKVPGADRSPRSEQPKTSITYIYMTLHASCIQWLKVNSTLDLSMKASLMGLHRENCSVMLRR